MCNSLLKQRYPPVNWFQFTGAWTHSMCSELGKLYSGGAGNDGMNDPTGEDL